MFSKEITIANKLIGTVHKPFIIAEMSGNHNQSLDRAFALVDAAAEAGADAIKLQTYTADTMTLDIKDGNFLIENPDSLWDGYSLYDLYEKAHTPWDWHKPIMDRCKEKGIICFSSPFDATAVDFLETLDVPCYKIASFENVDLPLIRKVAETGKPLIISTGMASISILEDCVSTAKKAGCKDLILLKCTSSYPASPNTTNINTIPHMRTLFDVQVGLSDHTLGLGVSVASIALGATVIEKHFTLDRSEGGVDAAFSLEPHELKALVKETERAHLSLGKVHYGHTDIESSSLIFRRSLYITEDIKAGEQFSSENIRAIRPGDGLSPKHFDSIIGSRASMDCSRGTPLSWKLIDHAGS